MRIVVITYRCKEKPTTKENKNDQASIINTQHNSKRRNQSTNSIITTERRQTGRQWGS
jgi:hypothetical protein